MTGREPLYQPPPRWQVIHMYDIDSQFRPMGVAEKASTDNWGPRQLVIGAATKADAIAYAANVWGCDPSQLDAYPV